METFTHPVTGETLSPSDIWGTANMLVVFNDGNEWLFCNVRFLMIPGFIDPIKVLINHEGRFAIEFENADSEVVTLLDVRGWMLDHTS